MNARHLLLALSGALTLAVGGLPGEPLAQERSQRRAPRVAVPAQPQPMPMLAVVGLREQRVWIYDRTGARMLESPVSSGSQGYETPPGIFSIVQKNLEHHSNLYDDASMPFMQRLTWTGIALHAGEIPGYPASHGCVRLPYDFARRIFDLTNVGMRVVVAREGIAPVAIAEPAFFKRNATTSQRQGPDARPIQVASVRPDEALIDRAASVTELAARVAPLERAAADAARRVRDERAAAAKLKAAVQPAERALRNAEAAHAKAEADLAAAEKVIVIGGPAKQLAAAEKAKADAPSRIEMTRALLTKLQGEVATKREASSQAEAQFAAATTAHAKAVDAVEIAKQNMSPVSVFVSRRTQRIYIRKAHHPLWEGPIEIRDADKPIGTFVFTANEPAEGAKDLRWSVVSLYMNPTAIEPPTTAKPEKAGKRAAPVELPVTDVAAVAAALDRLEIPQEMADRISETVLPGASLIISDEPPSLETGKDTDFVVVMSGEPQGGIAMRKPVPKPLDRSFGDDPYWGGGGGTQRGRRPPTSGSGFGFWFN